MLTPAEEVGLSGLSLASKVRRAFHSIREARLVMLMERIREEAFRRHLIYLRDGQQDAIHVMACPLTMLPDQLSYIHFVAQTIHNALKRLPDLYMEDPAVREALRLHEAADLHALIDISDGLAADLHHVCRESGCGAVLYADRIPIAEAARALDDGWSPLDHALADGEDFELIAAVSAADGGRLLREQPVPGITLYHVGECVDQGVWLERGERREALAARGYVHAMT